MYVYRCACMCMYAWQISTICLLIMSSVQSNAGTEPNLAECTVLRKLTERWTQNIAHRRANPSPRGLAKKSKGVRWPGAPVLGAR